MGDRGTYTPRIPAYTKAKQFKTPGTAYASAYASSVHNMERANSNESIQSGQTESSQNSVDGDLTLVAEYDELIRAYKKASRQDDLLDVSIDLTVAMKDMRDSLITSEEECRRLQIQIDEKTHIISDLVSKLNLARKMVDQEKRHAKKVIDENNELKEQMRLIREVLFSKNHNVLTNEGTEKLKFLNQTFDPNVSGGHHHLGAIPEGNTTGSLLSDFSFSRSEDDLDSSAFYAGRTWKKSRPSNGAESASKKRRSSTHRVVEINKNDSVRATTTLLVPKNGPITATSVIEAVPSAKDQQNEQVKHTPSAPPADLIYSMWQSSQQQEHQQRQHSLQAKTVVLPDTCGPCEKKLRFGKTALKCKDCRAVCHPECKNNLPLPCIPFVNTPNRNILGLISDFTPTSSPMVPALIVHCLNEIESRGLKELGIYRVPGSEKEVKSLKEKFLRGKGSPSLTQLDIHAICGTVKDFLRNLHEPLVTYKLWPKFAACVEQADENVLSGLMRLIAELPQPNRDTLAYMILHLKKVGAAPECKMPITNLAKVFGPTIVGFSSSNPSPESLFAETRRQIMVMEFLMNLSADYWSNFVNVQMVPRTPTLQQTPSTDSLLQPINRNFFTPNLIRSHQKQKIFTTPPNYRC